MAFDGFPKASLTFLAELEENNHKAWFEANKKRYQKELLEPAQRFVAAMGTALKAIVPEIQYDTRTNGSGSLMRIYRDVRFTADKTPYKTNLSGLFWQGPGKKNASSAFGFRLQALGMDLMAGIFSFPKPLLAAYQEAAADDRRGPALAQIVAALKESGDYDVYGEQYKRVPQGYHADHPRAELLKYKGLYAHPTSSVPAEIVCSSDCVAAALHNLRGWRRCSSGWQIFKDSLGKKVFPV